MYQRKHPPQYWSNEKLKLNIPFKPHIRFSINIWYSFIGSKSFYDGILTSEPYMEFLRTILEFLENLNLTDRQNVFQHDGALIFEKLKILLFFLMMTLLLPSNQFVDLPVLRALHLWIISRNFLRTMCINIARIVCPDSDNEYHT